MHAKAGALMLQSGIRLRRDQSRHKTLQQSNKDPKHAFSSKTELQTSSEAVFSTASMDAKKSKVYGPKNLKQSQEVLRFFFDTLAPKCKVAKLEDWYDVKLYNSAELNRFVGRKKWNLFLLLQKAYPEHSWLPWMFSWVPSDLWDDLGTRRLFLDWAIRKLVPEYASAQTVPLEAWYNFSAQDLHKLPGSKMVEIRYNCSLVTALQEAYPEHVFHVNRFKYVPSNFWDSKENRRQMIIDYISNDLKLDPTDREVYYRLKTLDAVQKGATFIISAYKNSVAACILDLFPELNLEPWKFQTVYDAWWDVEANQRRFMLEYALPELAKRLQPAEKSITDQQKASEDDIQPVFVDESKLPYSSRTLGEGASIVPLLELLYVLKDSDLTAVGGRPLLNRYRSIPAVARRVFPAFPWQRSKFTQISSTPTKTQKSSRVRKFKLPETVSQEHVISVFHQAAKDLNIKNVEDWYLSDSHDAIRQLSKRTKMPSFQLLKIAYPDHKWHDWLFFHPPQDFWKSPDNHRRYMEWALSQLKPSALPDDLSQWNSITTTEFRKLPKSTHLLERYDMSLGAALRQLYPSHSWTQRNLGVRRPTMK